MERKDTLASEIGELESRLDRLSREAKREQPEASRKLQEAASEIRRGRLADKMRYSKGLVRSGNSDYSRSFEEQLTQETDSLRQHVADAADGVRSGGRERREANESLERARDLVRGVESLQDRTRQERRLERGGSQGTGAPRGGQGQPGAATQGATGGARAQGGGGATTAPGMPGGGMGGEDVRQLAREYRERRRDAEALRRELGRLGVETGDLDRAIARMRSLEAEGAYEDQAAVERLQSSVIEGLKSFEFTLRRKLDATDSSRPVLGGAADVPPEFRALVEEYYRSLARNRKS